jgi:hypothetical protein
MTRILTRIGALVLSITLLIGLSATTVLAAITFHQGPTLTLNGTVATVTANLSGLGNDPATAFLTVNGAATYTCFNRGGNTAPGQNQVTVQPQSDSQNLATDKNGRASINLSTDPLTAPAQISGQAAGCPNGNWTGRSPAITVTSVVLTIVQNGQTIHSQTLFP